MLATGRPGMVTCPSAECRPVDLPAALARMVSGLRGWRLRHARRGARGRSASGADGMAFQPGCEYQAPVRGFGRKIIPIRSGRRVHKADYPMRRFRLEKLFGFAAGSDLPEVCF